MSTPQLWHKRSQQRRRSDPDKDTLQKEHHGTRHRLTANSQHFNMPISRSPLSSNDCNDEDIHRLIKLVERRMESSPTNNRSENASSGSSPPNSLKKNTEEYKRRVVHMAMYRSTLPKFDIDSKSDSKGTSTSSSDQSLRPKSVWSEDTPKVANLSQHSDFVKRVVSIGPSPNLMRDRTNQNDSPRSENFSKRSKDRGGKPRVKYCMAEKSTTQKFLHRLATNHFDMREYNAALEVFEEILRIQLSQLSPDQIEEGDGIPNENTEMLSQAYYNVAICHFYLKDYSDAALSFERCIGAKIQLHGNIYHSSVAHSYAHLGLSLYLSQQFHKSLSSYKKSLTIRQFCMHNDNVNLMRDAADMECAKLWNNIGCAQFELKLFDEAKNVIRLSISAAFVLQQFSFNESYDIAATILKTNIDCTSIDSRSALLDMADCLINLSSIDIEFGYLREALRQMEEAFSIQVSLLGKDDPTVEESCEKLTFLRAMIGFHPSRKADTIEEMMDGLIPEDIAAESESQHSLDTYDADLFGGCRASLFGSKSDKTGGLRRFWRRLQADFGFSNNLTGDIKSRNSTSLSRKIVSANNSHSTSRTSGERTDEDLSRNSNQIFYSTEESSTESRGLGYEGEAVELDLNNIRRMGSF